MKQEAHQRVTLEKYGTADLLEKNEEGKCKVRLVQSNEIILLAQKDMNRLLIRDTLPARE